MRSASRLLRRATAVRALVKATHAPPLAPAMLRAASERRIHTLCTHLSSSPIERDADKAPPRSSHIAFFSTGAGALRRRHLQASRFDSLALAAAGAAAGAASRASEEDLSVSQLQAILEESGVDTRTVFEKSELVSTLKAQKEVLPKSVRARLESLLSRTSAEAAPDSVPGGGLYQDEQSVVELFKVRPSLTQPTFSFLSQRRSFPPALPGVVRPHPHLRRVLAALHPRRDGPAFFRLRFGHCVGRAGPRGAYRRSSVVLYKRLVLVYLSFVRIPC